jgi:hypothetical protein
VKVVGCLVGVTMESEDGLQAADVQDEGERGRLLVGGKVVVVWGVAGENLREEEECRSNQIKGGE